MSNVGQIRNAYIVSVIGVGLMVISTTYNAVRAVMIRQMFQASAGAAGYAGRRPFGISPLANGLTILALVIAIAGLAWLGFAIRKSRQHAAK